jgi:hypothetical protein
MCSRKDLCTKASGGVLVKRALAGVTLPGGPTDLAIHVQDGVVVSFGVAFVRGLVDPKDRQLQELLSDLCRWACGRHGEEPLDHGEYWFHLNERGRLTRGSRTAKRKYGGEEED